MLSGIDKPTSYIDAATERNWQEAMKCEIRAVEKNNTWELTELPPSQKAIGLRWVYKAKKNTNEEIVKYKARILAKGYVQK